MTSVTSTDRRWLVLTFQLPASPTAGRVRVWRHLQRLGAQPVKGGAYVLPHTAQTREDFEWLRSEIAALRGDATLFVADVADPRGADALVAAFRAARGRDFKALHREAQALARRAASRAGDPRRQRAARQLAERLAHLESIDYFGATDRDAARAAIDALHRRAGEPMSPTTATVRPLSPSDFRNRTWVTRPRPGIDRFASAWLIRRFIDPRARFVFAETLESAARAVPKGIPFDMFGAEFGHQGSDCTFETLVRRFRLDAPGLDALGRVVHAVDLKDDRFLVPEAAAVQRMVDGLRQIHAGDDDTLLARGMEVIDALFRGGDQPRSPRRGRSRSSA